MKLSVIIPICNNEQTIWQLIKSIKPESYKQQLEVIIVENGSTDNSREQCIKIAQTYTNVTTIISDATSSGAALNKGLESASGQYIFMADADDLIYIEALLKVCDKMQSDVVHCKYKLENVRTNEITIAPRKQEFTNPYWNKVYRHAFLKKHKLSFVENINVQDGCFNSTVLLANPTIEYSDSIIYHYFVGQGSISDKMSAATFDGFILNNKLQQKLFASNKRNLKAIEFHKYYRFLVYTQITSAEFARATEMARSEWYPLAQTKKSWQHKKALAHIVYIGLLNNNYSDLLKIQKIYLKYLAIAGYQNQREYLFISQRFPKAIEKSMLAEMIDCIENGNMKHNLIKLHDAVSEL